jgi:hypothetical protein
MRARLSPPSVLLPHTCTQDGWFLQLKRQTTRLPRRTVPSNCICGCSRMRSRLSPPRVLLPRTCTQMDGFCNQNADQLGYLAGQSLLTVYVGVVECAPASPYTYSSSTHRLPDEHTPIEATPLSATSEFGLGLGLGLDHSHTPPCTHSPPSLHPPFTHYPFPLCSLVCGGQPSPHKPRLLISHSTCPPLSSSPHAHSVVLGTTVINTHNHHHHTHTLHR